MNSALDKVGVYDFFGVLLSGMIVIVVSCCLDLPLINLIANVENDIVNAILFLVGSFFLGLVLQEISSVLDKKVFKFRENARCKFLNDENKIIGNELELKSFRELANKILNKSNDDQVYNETENEYVFFDQEWYKENIRWTGILQQKLKEKDCRIVEEGLCGRTTVFEDELRKNRKGSDLLPVLLESHAPIDQVVLMLGTNDCKSYYHASAEVIGLGVEKLIGQIRQAGEHIKILLVSPILLGEKVWEPEYDPEFDEQSVETSRQLKTVYSRIAKKHGIDFLAASDVAEPSSRDREHMDEESHRRFAEAVYERLAG